MTTQVLASVLGLMCIVNVFFLVQAIREIHDLSKISLALLNSLERKADSAALLAVGVAVDLTDAHARADAVVKGPHGAAADAAARRTE